MATRTNTPPKPYLGFGTRIRKSPYFESTLKWGCKEYTTYNHMYFPVYYNTPEEDFWSLVNDVTLWDVAVERQVEIKGPDAAKFTQLLTPRNLSTCEVNQCKYVLNTNYQGGILSDPILLKLADDHFWYSISDSDLLLWAMGVAGQDKYDIELREPDVSPLQVQGPKSKSLITDLFGSWIDDLKYYWCKQTDLDGIPVVVSRTGWSGKSVMKYIFVMVNVAQICMKKLWMQEKNIRLHQLVHHRLEELKLEFFHISKICVLLTIPLRLEWIDLLTLRWKQILLEKKLL